MTTGRALLAITVIVAGCSGSPPPRDRIAGDLRLSGAPTREAATDVLQGTGELKGHVGCGEVRWFGFEPEPWNAGEIRAMARVDAPGRPASLEVTIVGDGDAVVAEGSARVRATAPDHDTVVVPFRIERRYGAPRGHFWLRVRPDEPCAPVTFLLWYRQPAMVGP